MKVKIKTWEELEKIADAQYNDRLVFEYFYFDKKLERLLPTDRVIEVKFREGVVNRYTWGAYDGRGNFPILPSWIENAQEVEEKKEEESVEQNEIMFFQGKLLSQALSNKKQHNTHYFKFECIIGGEYTVRYYLTFEDRKEYEGKFYLKNHAERTFIQLPQEAAKALIVKDGKEEEIIGRRLGNKFYKTIITKDGITQTFEKQS